MFRHQREWKILEGWHKVHLKNYYNSEGSCIQWFKGITCRTICNSTCAASSLGNYSAMKYNIRIQYQQVYLIFGELTILLGCTADCQTGRNPISESHARSWGKWMGCPEQGPTPTLQRGVCVSSRLPTTPSGLSTPHGYLCSPNYKTQHFFPY